MEQMIGISRQHCGQEHAFDSRERTNRLEIAVPSAIAARGKIACPVNSLKWNQDMPQFAGEPVTSDHEATVDDESSTQPGADDCRNRRRGGRMATACDEMTP